MTDIEAADRIEQLEAECNRWADASIAEDMRRATWRKALEEIAAMDAGGVRADDLGRAARIATDAILYPMGSLGAAAPEKEHPLPGHDETMRGLASLTIRHPVGSASTANNGGESHEQ